MARVLLLLFVVCFSFFTRAQNCANRYQTDIFTQVDVSTVQFGSAIKDDGTTQDLLMDIYHQPKCLQ